MGQHSNPVSHIASNIAGNISSAVKHTPAGSHHGGGIVPLPIIYPVFPFWGYGWGGGYGGRYNIKNELRKRQERLFDKYGIETESFDNYQQKNGGTGAATSLAIGAAVGLGIMALGFLAAGPLALAGIFYGLVFGLTGGALHSAFKTRKDLNGYNHYLDQEETKGRELQKGGKPAPSHAQEQSRAQGLAK